MLPVLSSHYTSAMYAGVFGRNAMLKYHISKCYQAVVTTLFVLHYCICVKVAYVSQRRDFPIVVVGLAACVPLYLTDS